MADTSVNPRRIAESLLTGHLLNTAGDVDSRTVRAYVEARAYEGMVAAADVDGLCEAIEDLIADAAEDNRITVTIKED